MNLGSLKNKIRRAVQRIKSQALFILEGTIAATLAWFVDTSLISNHQPFFAPAAAIVVLSQAHGQRRRRVVEVLVAVAGGILVGDLFLRALGPADEFTIFAVILVVLSVAIGAKASPVALVQATISALYLVVIPPSTNSAVPYRFFDALIGGGIALLFSQLVALRSPLKPLNEATASAFKQMVQILNLEADALENGNESASRAVLEQARGADRSISDIKSAASAVNEAVWLHLDRRDHLGAVRSIDSVIPQLDYFTRNLRVLTRSGTTLLRQTKRPWPGLATSLRTMSAAVQLGDAVFHAQMTNGLTDDQINRCETTVLLSVAQAGEAYRDSQVLGAAMVVGQIRASAVDLLRLIGRDDPHIMSAVDDALGLPLV